MALGGIVLSSSMRDTLTSLQKLQGNIDVANQRLATGKRVNSALDDPLVYYISESLTSRARVTSSVRDNVGQGLKVFEQVDKALSSIQNLLESNSAQIRTARQATGTNAAFRSYKAFTNPVTGVVDGTQPFDTANVANAPGAFEIGDQYTITLGALAPQNFAVPATNANAFIASINSNVVLNPVGVSPRVAAYLDDIGRIVIEARNGQNMVVTQTANAGVANSISEVFSFGGDPNQRAAPSGVAGSQTVTIFNKQNDTRATVAATVKNTLDQIELLARDAGYGGTNMLWGDSLRIGWNVEDTTSMITRGVILSVEFLGFARDNPLTTTGDTIYSLQSDDELKKLLDKTNLAVKEVSDLAAAFGSRQNIIKVREVYTTDSMKILNEGSDQLVVADINEEGANLLALQTRQQLSVQALQLAGQSEQAILRLF